MPYDGSGSSRTAFERYSDEDIDIYTIRPDGSGLRQVTTDAEDPSWSLDGNRIAFDNDEKDEIYTTHPDGTGLKRITNDGNTANPAWSPSQ